MHHRSTELQSKIHNIYNHLYANSFKKTPHGISIEVGKILHTWMFIEEKNKQDSAFQLNPQQLKNYMENESKINEYAGNIQRMFDKMNKVWNFYENNDQINMSNFDLMYTCGQLSGLYLSDTTQDIFGDTIEIIRGQWAKQVGGQFFTDSLVTKLAMTLLNFDPRKWDDLVDICSGTGGFLLAGVNHIRGLLEEAWEKNLETRLVSLSKQSLKGQEIDSDVCQIANSTLETRLGKNNKPFVVNGDSIRPESFEKNNFIKYNSHRCVASNPPFWTKITIKDSRILREYELAQQFSKNDKLINKDNKIIHRAPDILFLEQNVKLLVPWEGRLSIVLPYQILSWPQTLFVRRWLLKNTIIESVIDLPSETFQPHTGTKTSLITVKRRKKPLKNIQDIESYKIFNSMPKWIGHDRRGNRMFKKLPNGKSTNEVLTDFPEVKLAYLNYLKGGNPTEIHGDSFIVDSKDIISNELLQINAQFHKPSKFLSQSRKNSKNNWDFVAIDDLTSKIFYPTRFKRDYVDYFEWAVPFFGGADINQLISDTGKWISPLHPKIDELRVKENWLLITRSGSTGIASIVPYAWDGFAMSEHIIRIVPNLKKISPFYLLAFLRSKYCQEIISKGVFGSVIDEIDPNFIWKIKVPIPKDKKRFNLILKQVEDAEKARNEAILYTHKSLLDLNSILEGDFSID